MGTVKKPILIKNFLNEEELRLLNTYFKIRHRANLNFFDTTQNNQDSGFYADYFMETILIHKKSLVEKALKEELLPTYSYTRVYTHDALLPKHTDRPSCEVSVTVSVSSCGVKWPIKVNNKEYFLKKGEGLIYEGMVWPHERDYFKGDYQVQSFLHYVRKNGPYHNYVLDRRLTLGMEHGYYRKFPTWI